MYVKLKSVKFEELLKSQELLYMSITIKHLWAQKIIHTVTCNPSIIHEMNMKQLLSPHEHKHSFELTNAN